HRLCFNDPGRAHIYTLSLHDALPISSSRTRSEWIYLCNEPMAPRHRFVAQDRKSTRLNSSHANTSYALLCLKKKRLVHARPDHALMPCIHNRGEVLGHAP